MNVPVREFKNRLSEYLRRAEAGEEIVVVSRNRPVARLLPPILPGRREPDEESAIASLRSMPWVQPARGDKHKPPEPILRIEPGELSLAEIVREQRR